MAYDIIGALIPWLAGGTGADAYAAVPDPRPAEFITIERTGGSSSIGMDEPELSIYCWSSTVEGAHALALAVRDMLLLQAAADLPEVCKAECGSLFEYDDPETEQPRFELDVWLVTRL